MIDEGSPRDETPKHAKRIRPALARPDASVLEPAHFVFESFYLPKNKVNFWEMESKVSDKSAKKLAKKPAKAQLSLNTSNQENQAESKEERKRRRGIEKEDKRKRKEEKIENSKKKEQKNLEKELKKSKKEERKRKKADNSREEERSQDEGVGGDQDDRQEEWREGLVDENMQVDDQAEGFVGEKKKKKKEKDKGKGKEKDSGKKSKSEDGKDSTAAASNSSGFDIDENSDLPTPSSQATRPDLSSKAASTQATSRPRKRSKTSATTSKDTTSKAKPKSSTSKSTSSILPSEAPAVKKLTRATRGSGPRSEADQRAAVIEMCSTLTHQEMLLLPYEAKNLKWLKEAYGLEWREGKYIDWEVKKIQEVVDNWMEEMGIDDDGFQDAISTKRGKKNPEADILWRTASESSLREMWEAVRDFHLFLLLNFYSDDLLSLLLCSSFLISSGNLCC